MMLPRLVLGVLKFSCAEGIELVSVVVRTAWKCVLSPSRIVPGD